LRGELEAASAGIRPVPEAHFSIAVVGAGPAGATAANALCLGKVRDVALIDRARFPRDKACGDAITGGAVDVMREIGLDHLLASHPRIQKIVMTAPSGAQAIIDQIDTEQPLPQAHVIPRKVFDAYLAAAAFARGAADLTGYRLERADRHDGRWLLELSQEAAPIRHRRRVTADFLIGADGATSRVRRSLGLPFNADKHTSIGVRAYATTAADHQPLIQLDMIDGVVRPGFGWQFSIGPRAVNVGIGAPLLGYKGQSRHLHELLAFYGAHLGEGLVLDKTSAQSAPLPLASQLARLAFPKQLAALLGDAASMINPLTGEGISYGMIAGLLLGRTLADAISRGGELGAAAVRYEQEFKARYGAHFRNNWLMTGIVRHRALVERAVATYRRDTALHRAALDFALGGERTISFTRLLWRGLVFPKGA
jgi:geranylgeranyl reductase family protein